MSQFARRSLLYQSTALLALMVLAPDSLALAKGNNPRRKQGAEPEPKKEDVTALHKAAEKGDAAAVTALLKGDARLVNARRTPGGITPVGRAVVFGKIEVVRVLLEAGADPNLAKADGATPLHDAAHQNDAPLMTLLLDHKANIDARTADGRTPLYNAVRESGASVVRFLLEKGADPRIKDASGISPLLLALMISAASGDGAAAKSAESATIVLDSVPVSLQLANTSLAEAITQALAPTKIESAVDSKLTAPVTLTANGSLLMALSTLRRIARRAGQPFSFMTEKNRLIVSPGETLPGQTAGVAASPPAETGGALTTNPRYRFSKTISRDVLNRYLARAVTHYGLCSTSPEPASDHFEDDLRMLTNIGAKFVGRAAYAWVPPDDEEGHFKLAQERAAKVAAADPEMILEACIFEAVYETIERIPVPDWVFIEFGLPMEKRTFRYDAMLYNGGRFRNHWTQGASIPDMTKTETQMYFYYRARRYIDSGFEAIHFGQVHLMDHSDLGHVQWLSLLTRVRRYAAQKARRHIALCNAHTHGVVVKGGNLLFDFHCYPLRSRDIGNAPLKVELVVGYHDSIYRRSLGGIAPSGWSCASLPYLCEFDHFGASAKPGQASDFPWNWGYDISDWFAHQPAERRGPYLRYAREWLRELNEGAYLLMPTRLNLSVLLEGVKMWHANRRSPACPTGFNLEDEIKTLWAENEPIAR